MNINNPGILDGSVTTAKIADHAVTGIKVNGTSVAAAVDAFVGDSGSGGLRGEVPAPAAGDAAAGKVLGAGGGWVSSVGNTRAAAAWCTFDGTAVGTNPPTAGFNVTSVTRNSAGNWTINFTSAMGNTAYATLCDVPISGGSGFVVGPSSKASGSCTIQCINFVGSNADVNPVSVVIFN